MPDLDETYWRQLGERAVACKGWRWMPGSVIRYTVDGHAHFYRLIGDDPSAVVLSGGPWPDFRDPATVGCLLVRVREQYGDPGISTYLLDECVSADWWELCDTGVFGVTVPSGHWPTEPEALVAALEACGA